MAAKIIAFLSTAVLVAASGCSLLTAPKAEEALTNARSFAQKGDVSSAAKYYAYAWEAKKGTAEGEKIFTEAAELFKKGLGHKNACRIFEEFVKNHPDSGYAAEALQTAFELAIEHAESGWGKKRLGELAKRFPAAPLAAEATYLAGVYLFKSKKNDEAEETFEKLIRNYPESERVEGSMFMLGELRLRRYEGPDYEDTPLQDAKKQFELLIASYPTGAYAVKARKRVGDINRELAKRDYQMGLYYIRHGKPDSAKVYLESVQKEYPETEYARKAAKTLAKLLEKKDKR